MLTFERMVKADDAAVRDYRDRKKMKAVGMTMTMYKNKLFR